MLQEFKATLTLGSSCQHEICSGRESISEKQNFTMLNSKFCQWKNWTQKFIGHGRDSTLDEEDICIQQVRAKGEGKEMTLICVSIKSLKGVCSSPTNKSHCIKPHGIYLNREPSN